MATKSTNPSFTISTSILKEMVSRATKGASNNKMIVRTAWMAIELKKKKLTLTTSDGTNYLYIMQNKVDGNDLYAVVLEEKFTRLISLLTCDSVTVELTDSALEITGNGKYTIELQLDEDGEKVKYPNPAKDIKLEIDPIEVNIATVKTILTSCRPALTTTMEYPAYMNYYCGGNLVIATDRSQIAALNTEFLGKHEVLVMPEVMDLANVITDETFEAFVVDNDIVFKGSNCWIYGKLVPEVEDFDIDTLTKLLHQDFKSVCKLNKNAFLSVLDRVNLFVGPYDDKCVQLVFTEEGVNVLSRKTTATEVLPYLESETHAPFTCLVNVDMLCQQIKATTEEIVTLHYGNENCLKFTFANITQIIALSEDEEEKEE